MYKKLTLKDIKILHDGQQIKKAILEEFGCIENFMDVGVVQLSKDTIESYLRRNIINSDRCKYKVMVAFNKNYHEIVRTTEEQIQSLTDTSYANITKYRDEEDIKVLEKILALCESYDYKLEIAKAHLVIGMYYGMNKRFNDACNHLQIAENEFQNHKAYHLLITVYSEQAVAYFYSNEHEKAEHLYNKIKKDIDKCRDLDDRTLFNYLYNVAILYSSNKKQLIAEEFFTESLRHAMPGLERGSVIMGIGLSWKRRGEYNKAIEYYESAAEEFKDLENKKKSVIYNNLAEIYNDLRNYEEAILNIDKALALMAGNKHDYCFAMHLTRATIFFAARKLDKMLEEIEILFDIIEKRMEYNLQRKHIIECFNQTHLIASTFKDNNLLTKLSKVIACVIKQEYNNEYISELKNIYADVCLSIE